MQKTDQNVAIKQPKLIFGCIRLLNTQWLFGIGQYGMIFSEMFAEITKYGMAFYY